MKKINRLFINFNKTKREIKEIYYNEISLNNFIIIDVRSRREYREGHINNAINIPLCDIKKYIESKVPNTESKILVYCTAGLRSKKAAEVLEQMGYKNVYNLKGGIENI